MPMVGSAAAPEFDAGIPDINGQLIELPLVAGTPLFVVGANGSGKSGLMHQLYTQNLRHAVRVAAHRPNWMEGNASPFSTQERLSNRESTKANDATPRARWTVWNAAQRSGMILADLISVENRTAREVRATLKVGGIRAAVELSAEATPLVVINELMASSGIHIELSITADETIVASKAGGSIYSAALLSDGERAALLVAGAVMTAEAGSLILIDEPERHLHSSIVTPLLSQLLAKRPDCTFVVSTHELTLPLKNGQARTVIVRDSKASGDSIIQWDLDVLEPGIDVDDATKKAILGARRKILFIEGDETSLDKPLYELLFPGVSIYPRATCRDVEHAVASLRDTNELVWVQGFGIVDQDQIGPARKATLQAKGVFPLSVYSVEALYYDPVVVQAIAERQIGVHGGSAETMVATAKQKVLAAISGSVDRLAARMVEQRVKDQISAHMPDWKKIRGGHQVAIGIDTQPIYETERKLLQDWVAAGDVDKIIARYPIREANALEPIAIALKFRGRADYEASVRKLVADNPAIKDRMLAAFDVLPAALA